MLETNLIVAFAGASVATAAAPSSSATSTWCFAITGRASEVPSRYLCSYTAPAFRAGKT